MYPHTAAIVSIVMCAMLGLPSQACQDAAAQTQHVEEVSSHPAPTNVAHPVGTLHVGERTAPVEIGNALPPHQSGIKLRVGVCDLPPWTIAPTESKPYWSGLGALVWQKTVANLGIDYTLSVHSYPGLLEAVSKGDIDVAMTGIPIIPENIAQFGMTPPFDQSGVSIATRVRGALSFASVTERIITSEITTWLFALPCFAGLFALLFWSVERKKDDFVRVTKIRGLGESIWWSLTTLATVGYGDRVPTTSWGKLIGAIWMAVGFLLMTIATAVFTSVLTAARLQPIVKSQNQLIKMRVGVGIGSTGDTYVTRANIPAIRFATFEEAVAALREQSIDAIVGSSTTLAYLVEQNPGEHITVLPRPLIRDYVSFGTRFGLDSALEKRIELEIVKASVSPEYAAMRTEMLGGIDATSAKNVPLSNP